MFVEKIEKEKRTRNIYYSIRYTVDVQSILKIDCTPVMDL